MTIFVSHFKTDCYFCTMSYPSEFVSVFARNCVVRRIDASTARLFLEKNHRFGFSRCGYSYGLFEGLQATHFCSSPNFNFFHFYYLWISLSTLWLGGQINSPLRIFLIIVSLFASNCLYSAIFPTKLKRS